MKTLVIYYSFTGVSKNLAEKYAASQGYDILALEDPKPMKSQKAYLAGSMAAMAHNEWPVKDFDIDPDDYETLKIFAPVWVNNPPPQLNVILNHLPSGKDVDVEMVSASGNSGQCRDYMKSVIESAGCTMSSYEDVKR
jgi:hypothetical protein